LLEWGEEHRRDLPWRRTRDPWSILVSEVMLQQTQVDRVVPHYGRFLAAFPTPAACAAAGPAAVVRLWSGLGYNRRALNLHRAAAAMVAEHDGQVPEEETAAVDTNGVRVLARAVAGAPLALREAMALGDHLVPAGKSWEFNQAMFDLGATVCTASRPGCLQCPLRRQCAWLRAGGTTATADGSDGTDGTDVPDPWRASPTARPQSTFAGSDRQGRGRLLHALRQGAVRRADLAAACGWPEDTERAERITAAVVAEGFAAWSGGKDPILRLR